MMTNKEIQKALSKAEVPEWFKNLKVSIHFEHLHTNLEKEGFESIYNYMSRQLRGWNKLEDLPSHFVKSVGVFNLIVDRMDQFVTSAESWNEQTLNRQWNEVVQQINHFTNNKVFTYDAPETSFLLEIHKHKRVSWDGALHYIITTVDRNRLNDPNYINGILNAYEFKNKDSDITKRRNKEKSTFTRLHKDIEDLFQKDNELFRDHLDKLEADKESLKGKYEGLLNTKRNEFESWFNSTKSTQEEFVDNSDQKVKELEELYKEKLKLEAPAKYWKDRADSLNTSGIKWLTGLIITTVVAVASLAIVLYFISDGTLKELFDGTGSAIRWSIVFITFVSFLAYAIRTFAKLTFSAFHLSRDAEEREQLVYVYLALTKEKGVDETERHLIMQSLFSRADTGLLKDDASPTMPGNIVDKIIAGK